MWRGPEVVVLKDRSRPRIPLIDLSQAPQPDYPDEAMSSTPWDPRRGVRTEGTKRPEKQPEPEPQTAMAAALKRAQDEQNKREEERVAAKRQKVQDRLDRLRNTVKEPTSKPAAQSAQATAAVEDIEDAIMQTVNAFGAAPKTPDKAPIVQTPRPEDTFRLPDTARRVERPAPDDPRVANGTLTPSPRVAEHIETMKGERTTPPWPPAEKPLTTGVPEGYRWFLEHGNLVQIVAGRKPDQLRGEDKDAYDRVMREGTPDQIRADRPLITLTPEEHKAYHQALGRKSADARKARWGTSSPTGIRAIKDREAGRIVPRKLHKLNALVAAPEAPAWLHRLIAALNARKVNSSDVSKAIGEPHYWLRDKIRFRQVAHAEMLPNPQRKRIAKFLRLSERDLMDEAALAELDAAPEGVEPPTTVGEREVAVLAEAAAPDKRKPGRPRKAVEPEAQPAEVGVLVDGVKYLPTFAIEDDVPLPAPPGVIVWGFATMKVGQSFGVPIDHTGAAAVLKKVEKAVAKFMQTSPWTFQVAERPGEVRCWRVS